MNVRLAGALLVIAGVVTAFLLTKEEEKKGASTKMTTAHRVEGRQDVTMSSSEEEAILSGEKSFVSEASGGDSLARNALVEKGARRPTVRGQARDLRVSLARKKGDVTALLINEFNPRGKGKNREKIEFYVLSGGNLQGCVFYVGTKGKNRWSFTFPSLQVQKGEYLLLHCQGTGEERTELRSKNTSNAPGSSDAAWDLWTKGKRSKLPDAKGILTLYSPRGVLLDAVFYARDANDASTQPLEEQISELVSRRGWVFAEGSPRFDDAIPSQASTPTRSLCRDAQSGDTDRKEDWHTVPTRGSSFGEVNSEDVYATPSS